MAQFKNVTVKFKDPKYNYKTFVNKNCSNEEIEKYFLNALFNRGAYPVEDMQKCISVEIQKDLITVD